MSNPSIQGNGSILKGNFSKAKTAVFHGHVYALTSNTNNSVEGAKHGTSNNLKHHLVFKIGYGAATATCNLST